MAADKATATGADLGDGLRKRINVPAAPAPGVLQPQDNKKLAKKVGDLHDEDVALSFAPRES
jgi:hypothetical protein